MIRQRWLTITIWAGKVPQYGLLFIQTLRWSSFLLHMEERSRHFAVWWRCVLTQWGDEDGILMGLIELMVLSPLVGEECQPSLWLCVGWLLSACCSNSLALIWLSSLSPLKHAFFSPSNILLSFYFLLKTAFNCFQRLCHKRLLFIQLLISWSVCDLHPYIPSALALAWFVYACVCVIMEGWHLSCVFSATELAYFNWLLCSLQRKGSIKSWHKIGGQF